MFRTHNVDDEVVLRSLSAVNKNTDCSQKLVNFFEKWQEICDEKSKQVTSLQFSKIDLRPWISDCMMIKSLKKNDYFYEYVGQNICDSLGHDISMYRASTFSNIVGSNKEILKFNKILSRQCPSFVTGRVSTDRYFSKLNSIGLYCPICEDGSVKYIFAIEYYSK